MVRLPAVMGPIVMEAVSGTYERGRQGPGRTGGLRPVPLFEVLLRACTVSAVHLEMRDSLHPR